MNKNKFYKITLVDYFFTAIFLFLSFFLIIPIYKNSYNSEPTILIYQNGHLIQKESSIQDKIINLSTMKLEVKKGKVRVVNSLCPRRICVHYGWISKPNQQIVCVPNKILVELVGEVKKEYDVISY